MVFYRKYRPQKLSELVGQDHIRKTLLAQLETGKISHAYLFCGPKGSGKTTTARILAKAVNCNNNANRLKTAAKNNKTDTNLLTLDVQRTFSEPCDQCDSCQAILADRHLDVIEIDAASNRGIDDIRNLREKIKLAPLMGVYKVYIIDEVHMLTTEAFNALLKILEEPPTHVMFILCTTAPEKLPVTIISRCQRFDFTRAREKELLLLLKRVVEKENLEIGDDLLAIIAKRAEGSFRDALSLLDQLSLSVTFGQGEMEKVLPYTAFERVSNFVQYLVSGDAKEAIRTLNDFVELGVDLKVFLTDLLSWLRRLLFYKEGVKEFVEPSQLTTEVDQKLEEQAKSISRKKILELLRLFSTAVSEMKNSPIPQLPIEIAVVQSCHQDGGDENDKIGGLSRQKLERKVAVDSEDDANEKTSANLSVQLTTIEVIKTRWPAILEKVKSKNSSLSALLSRCQPSDLRDGKLFLDVPFKFHKERLEERGSRYLVERTIGEFFGQPIKVEVLLKKDENLTR